MNILGIDLGTEKIRICPNHSPNPEIEEITAKTATKPSKTGITIYESHFLERLSEKRKIKSIKQTPHQALKQCLSSSTQVKGSAAVVSIPAHFNDAVVISVKKARDL